VRESLRALLDEHELVVIEGAGSPAEINLRATECVNFSVAKACRADVYLVVDIDRGGAFAHLLGTWMALEPDEQALVKGFVLNRFRGDPALLLDAPRWLEERTGVPIVAVVPFVRHVLPEEDAFVDHAAPGPGAVRLALVLYPYASNLDEWDPLRFEPGVNVVPIRGARRLDGFDAILLPGSKNTAASLSYLRTSGLAEEIQAAAARGVRVLGVCGGAQILGRAIHDPEGVESAVPTAEALGLLDLETRFRRAKTVRRTMVVLEGAPLSPLDTYEIHHGEVEAGGRARATLADGLGFAEGAVEGVLVHDLPRSTAWRQRFLEGLGWRGRAIDFDQRLDGELDRVARLVDDAGLTKAIGL
jgi:adenosylcobyric acid synthase